MGTNGGGGREEEEEDRGWMKGVKRRRTRAWSMEGGEGEKRNDLLINSFFFSNFLALRLILKRKRYQVNFHIYTDASLDLPVRPYLGRSVRPYLSLSVRLSRPDSRNDHP